MSQEPPPAFKPGAPGQATVAELRSLLVPRLDAHLAAVEDLKAAIVSGSSSAAFSRCSAFHEDTARLVRDVADALLYAIHPTA